MTPILRPAIRADLDALVELEEVSFDSDWFSRRQLSHLILRANARTLVVIQPDEETTSPLQSSSMAADSSNVMAALWPTGSIEQDDATPLRSVLGYGTLLFRRNSQRARLYSFCLHPDARGRGLAQQLLSALECLACEQGCQQLDLEVHTGNAPAIALYERHGFAKYGRLTDYYADGASAWKMRKTLTALVDANAV
ncbi:GNAT family N-acetyltransferase [Cobetia sp. L2A1]|uniref:GNAT family N-acetyltransferase n=1 Tax=Cobetia sp. L2A1 TaxID=2686360 RepID=UPI00131DFE24|nr:N-acetyltransferase [Cobetia sp. L2A1]